MDECWCRSGPIQWALIPGAKRDLPDIEQERYLTMPFLFTLPGVKVEELPLWEEGDQQWRRLRVYFPDSVATHCSTQDFYFGEDFLLRRHDYCVDVSGALPAAQYVHDYIEADGLRMLGKRRAYRRDESGQAIEEQLLVSIDITNLRYA